MPLHRGLYLVPLALAGLSLVAGEDSEKAPKHKRCDAFGLSIQVDQPLRDLQDSLDHRTGYGLGLQWTHDHGDYHASRTRFEWNTFPEGHPVGPSGATTYAKNLTLSFDHLFRLNEGPTGMYLVGGLGGVRWSLDQHTPAASSSLTTTKLAVTAGVGLQVNRQFTVEGRYVFSGIQTTFDSNTAQISAAWRF
ncbi:outer membrane beta-barrel protein [Geothrix sp. PMB-07]|uniref:outer membrane beta-barrel protein n=1 Tax=Geothrix sp. PMB-07 TaxID=3068640 RepID=UPI0027423222|nr:outer membrane beta-barrel protein [Geothrix sp. PMB-07]WLT31408.1 outer membrane beta-barrel protein [Geothrix sp. PMB-07]